MEPAVAQGEMVLVLPRNGGRTVYQAMVSQPLADGVALDLSLEEGPDGGFQRRDRLVLVLLRGESRFAAEGIVVAAGADSTFRVQLLSAWRFIERRLFPRFETSMRVQIAAIGGSELIDARVLDLSSGGLRLAAARPLSDAIEVIVHGDEGTRLPCDVVGTGRIGREFELRAQFRPLSGMQRRFVQDMVSALEALNDQGRNLLAS